MMSCALIWRSFVRCVGLIVWPNIPKRGSLGPIWAVMPQKKNYNIFIVVKESDVICWQKFIHQKSGVS